MSARGCGKLHGPPGTGALKMTDMKMQDMTSQGMKLTDEEEDEDDLPFLFCIVGLCNIYVLYCLSWRINFINICCCCDWYDFHVSGDTGSSCRQLLWGLSERQRDGVTLVSYGHTRFCATCVDRVVSIGTGCPICRADIQMVIRIYNYSYYNECSCFKTKNLIIYCVSFSSTFSNLHTMHWSVCV